MQPTDLTYVNHLANQLHTDYPEDAEVFAERLRLYPSGCHVLIGDMIVTGYAVAHPWKFGQPVALNSMLGALPVDADTLYLHDLALGPWARGKGAAAAHIRNLVELAAAEKLPSLSLTAVNNSTGFWRKAGFLPLAETETAGSLASYGAEARLMVYDLARAQEGVA